MTATDIYDKTVTDAERHAAINAPADGGPGKSPYPERYALLHGNEEGYAPAVYRC